MGATQKGYGVVRWEGKNVAVHRLSFKLAYGYYPEVVRHRCDNPPCFNAEHLVGGTHADNTQDKIDRGRARGGKYLATHCVSGHEFSEENTYWEPRGWGRACKTCRREAVRRMRARKKEACVS